MWPCVDGQHVFHGGYKRTVGLWRDDPVLPAMRFETVFLSVRPIARTRWPSCDATWPGCALSWTRSRRSNKHVWNGWNGGPSNDRMRWRGCWPALSVSASRRQTCWCMKFCRRTCVIEERWRATLVSPAHRTRAVRSDGRKACSGAPGRNMMVGAQGRHALAGPAIAVAGDELVAVQNARNEIVVGDAH